MMKDYTDITVIIDESGSMHKLKNDVKGSIKKFVEDQRKVEGKCVLTMVKFSDVIRSDKVIDINEFKELEYEPDNGTALLDAVCMSIKKAGIRFKNMEEDKRPDKVIFVILTDGEENSSTVYNKEQMAEMIKEQEEKYDWKFIYLGANQDAIAVASTYNMRRDISMTYANTEKGLENCMFTASAHVAAYRNSGLDSDLHFSAEDRDLAMEGENGKI